MDRVFVPLNRDPFDWFSSGKKKWELRKNARQFTEKTIKNGRRIELRLGYSTNKSLWGNIDAVVVSENIKIFFDNVDWKLVIPTCSSRDEAEFTAKKILTLENDNIPVIGFRIMLDT